jgi:hypothetical protein
MADAKRAPGSSVNINMPKSINAGDEEIMKAAGKDALLAQQTLPLFDIAQKAAQNAPNTGAAGEAVLGIERWKGFFNLENDAPAYEVLKAMQSRLGSLQRLPGSGSTSDYEYAAYMQAVPSLLNSQGGNVALARIGKKLTMQRLKNYSALQSYVMKNGSSVGFVPDDQSPLDQTDLAIIDAAASGKDIDALVQGPLKVGDVRNGRPYLGGDPWNPKSWGERVSGGQ